MLPRGRLERQAEQGFMLVGLIVAIFIILLLLGVAAPRVAKQLRREREIEAVHRGNQYVRAVQLYYRKNGRYPGSMEQLEKTNNVRYLRQRYPDPMTGKPDWKLIHVGEAKTTVKGFFGKALAGLPGGALGNSLGAGGSVGAGSAVGATGVAGASGASGSSFGASGSGASGSSFGASSGSSFGSSSGSSFGSSSFGSSSTSSGGATGSASGVGATTDSSGLNSKSASSMNGTGAPIMGVGSAATGNSIVVLNEQTTYPTWEFIYDPRIEQLKAKTSLLGGAMSSTSVSNMGGNSTTPGAAGSSTPGASGAGAFGAGSSGSGGSSFGSSSFGSGGMSGTPSQPQTTP
ncbi:MAG: type II secretion system protein [Granulicella sp.]